MKTYEEIYRAASLCLLSECSRTCPYYKTVSCNTALMLDIFACLEQLEAEREGRAMSETPKCPGCGREMVLREDFHKFFFVCLDCGWKSPYGQNEKEGLDLALKRAEPKNRVLTLEELKAHKGFVWAESSPKIGSSFPAYVENEILSVDGDEINLNDNDFTYGEYGRCWLRKPTPKEMEATPWES